MGKKMNKLFSGDQGVFVLLANGEKQHFIERIWLD